MNKKTLSAVILAILLFATVQASALSVTNFTGSPSGSYFEPLLDMFAAGANSGLGTASKPGKLLTFGVQANITINPEEDILSQAENKDNYTMPLVFANIRLGRITLFARGLVIDQKDVNFKYYGGGVGFTLIKGAKLFPQIRILGAYHKLIAEDAFFELQSITAAAVADYKLPLPVLDLSVFAVAGYERNNLTTTWNPADVGGEPNKDIDVNRYRLSLGARFGLFGLLYASYELTIEPNINHNISLSVQL